MPLANFSEISPTRLPQAVIDISIRIHLRNICATLNAHGVEYILVGGAAVSYYGFSRPSGIGQFRSDFKVDLDFWYNPTIANFERIINALDDLNVDTTELRMMVFDRKRSFLKIPHKNFHTDFLPGIDGLDSFRASKRKAEALDIGDVIIYVIALDDLIKNKRAINRAIDQSDITELTRLRKGKRK